MLEKITGPMLIRSSRGPNPTLQHWPGRKGPYDEGLQ